MWIVFLLVVVVAGIAFVGLFLYGLIGTACWFWQIGATISGSLRADKGSPAMERAANVLRNLFIGPETRMEEDARVQEMRAKADQYIIEKREQDRQDTLVMTQRFAAHVIRTGPGAESSWTLESLRSAFRPPGTIGEVNELAQLVGLDEFTHVAPPYTEGSKYARGVAIRLAGIGGLLEELVGRYGGAVPVEDVPEFAQIVPAQEIETSSPSRDKN